MGKKGKRHGQGSHKKSKNKRAAEETADDNQGEVEGTKNCGHVMKAAKLGVLQNNIPHMKLRECSFCEKGQDEDAGVCMCLRCGKQGCDRYSEEKHALQHHDSTPSHCLTVNLHSMMVWCYSCDMEVPVVPNTDVHECIKLLFKALKMDPPSNQMSSTPNVHAESRKKSKPIHFNFASNSNKTKGLVNLGNTCFFNAVMQNLFQMELLHLAMAFVNQPDYSQIIMTKSDLPSLSVQVTTPPGSLITALTKLLYQYRFSSPGPLNPKFLFSEICKKAPRFRGFQQQDSQELLRYLLDSVRTEQMRRVKIGVLKAFEISETTEVKSLPEEKKQKLKEYVSHVAAPSVDSLFAGRLDSIVVCHECHKESRVTESFLDLSLSLAVPQSLKGKLNKTPAVSQRSTKNPSHHDNQSNRGKDENSSSTKAQTPSKHQMKAAREARRKKAKKGKKRTISHSASDNGKQETKQPEETMDATSDESDHEEHQDALTTKQDTADQKSTGISCAETSGEGKATKDTGDEEADPVVGDDTMATAGIEETKDSGKSDSLDNSALRNDLTEDSERNVGKDFEVKAEETMDPEIPIESAKESGDQIKNGVAKNSGINETSVEDLEVEEITANDFEEECSQDVLDTGGLKDPGMELKEGTGEDGEETMVTDPEKYLSEEPDIAINETRKVESETLEGVSEQHPNSDFQMMGEKNSQNGENCCSNDKINGGEQDARTEEDSHLDCLNNISSDRLACVRPRTIYEDGSVDRDEGDKPRNGEILANAMRDKRESQHESGNLEETNLTEIEAVKDMDKNLEMKNTESQGRTLPQEEIARCNSCENCGKINQSCEIKNCGCLEKDDQNKAGETTENAFQEEPKIANSLPAGMKKLEITDTAENIISGENTEEQLEHKNGESNDNNPEISPIFKDNAEKKVKGDFLPKVRTLGIPYSWSPGECSVQSCLTLFCSPEILEGKNKFACQECRRRKKRGDSGQQSASSSDDDDDDDDSSKGATASKTKTKKESKKSCIVYTEATKQLLLSYTPPVLTLHFKRFQQVGFGLRKDAKHVDFPLVLDLAPFCRSDGEISSDSKQQVLYSLIGVVEHSGGLNSGHYTACVKLKSTPTYGHFTDLSVIKDFACFIERMWKKDQGASYAHAQSLDGQWYHVSDSRVSMVTEARVLKSQAYMLFYERLPLRLTSNVNN